jgi:fido (protein-threonine AMPylation protein)
MAMSDPLVPVGDGNTELSEQDREGLLPSYVATRGDLFDAEQRNIAEAMLRRRPTVDELLDDKYLRDLHREMFGRVWAWAWQISHPEDEHRIRALGDTSGSPRSRRRHPDMGRVRHVPSR